MTGPLGKRNGKKPMKKTSKNKNKKNNKKAKQLNRSAPWQKDQKLKKEPQRV